MAAQVRHESMYISLQFSAQQQRNMTISWAILIMRTRMTCSNSSYFFLFGVERWRYIFSLIKF